MTSSAVEPTPPIAREWSARLSLEYVSQGNETVLTRRHHEGPLRVQRPFLESTGVCQTYVLHPPGGIVGGDTLDVRVRVQEKARALLTTPGATKFYRSGGEEARQMQHLSVGPGASVEWLPQETIVFDEAVAATRTTVHLEHESRCALWEVTCLGRPAGARPFLRGSFKQKLEVFASGRPVILESSRCDGGAALGAAWGFQGFPVYGTLVLHPLSPDSLTSVRAAVTDLWHASSEHRFGASQLPYSEQESTIVCRYLGSSADYCKQLFTKVWQTMRPHLLGIDAEPPRVWRT